ncbi:hypothetical protein WA556_003767 [Blastocystis sp. ATCC 50177/Nand II]
MSILSVATNLARILRNICSNNEQNQSLILKHEIPFYIIKLSMDKHLWAAGEMGWSEWFETFLQVSLQLIFNVLTNNEEAKHSVWPLFFPDCFNFLLKHFSHNTKITTYTLAVLYNFVNDSASLPRLAEFTHTADSVNLLFARSLSEDYTDTSSEWITYITRTILVASSVPVIAVETNATPAETTTETPTTTTPETTSKTTTDTTADTTHCLFTSTLLSLRAPSFPLVSPAQVLFLFYCLKVCDTNTPTTLSQPAAFFLLHWLVDTVDRTDVLVTRGAVRVFDEAKLGADAEFPLKLLVEALGVCLTLVAGGIHQYTDQVLSLLMSDRLLELLLAVLAVPLITVPLANPVVGDCGEKQGQPMITQQDDLWPFGTRDAVLQLLGNAVYGSRAAQDKLREKGGIELVLNHTKMHPKHPLQREWALFTIRNLCADNVENQKYISQFKEEAMDNNPALEKLGVKRDEQPWSVC